MPMPSRLGVPAQRIVWPAPPLGGGESATAPLPATIRLDAAVGSGNLGPRVVLDFGRERFGGLRLRVPGTAEAGTCRVRVRLGESVSEATTSTRAGTVVEIIPGATWTSGVTGFRFASVELAPDSLAAGLMLPEAYDAAPEPERLGSFACSDERLNRIWEVGARTVGLCMQGQVWDGIKRGQTVWAGDLYPALDVIAAAFGPHPDLPASLDELRDRTPLLGTWLSWMNGIPGYSLWWIHCQAAWFAYSGDRPYLEAQRPYLVKLLGLIGAAIDAQGCEHYEGWRYLDWTTTEDPVAVHVGYEGLTALALRAADPLLALLGESDAQARCLATLDRLMAYQTPSTACKQARALMVLGGLASARPANLECLAPDPAAGLSPYLGYAVLEARALAGDHAGALDLIGRFWGAMLDLGATTWWEEFALDWAAQSDPIDVPVGDPRRDVHAGRSGNRRRGHGLSLCHAWSAGPTAWLSRHVLGVQPVEPGCQRVRVEPWLGPLDHAEGEYPTPHGPIHVRHERRRDGSIASDVVAPEGVTVLGPAGGGMSR